MKNWMTKKNVLRIGLTGSLLFCVFIFATKVGLCDQYNGSCIHKFDSVSEVFQIFIPVLLFSLITYKLRDEIFTTWIKFATWWVLGTFILVLIAPSQDPSLLSVTKQVISLLSTALFALISTGIVISKSLALRGK